MGSALFAAFLTTDYDPRTSQLVVLDCFPPYEVCRKQFEGWDYHVEQLRAIRDRKPHMSRLADQWLRESIRPHRFWHLLACAGCPEETMEIRLGWLRAFEREFPEAYRTGHHPPLLPFPLAYAD